MARLHTLVVGGTKGAGRAFAARAAAAGHVVSILGRSDAGGAAGRWAVDVADGSALARTLDAIASERGAVNTVACFQRFRGGSDAWAGELATTLTATRQIIEWVATNAAAPASIVLVGSMAAQFVAAEQPEGYHAAKAALVHLARYYAVTLGPKGIRVNAVSSGTIVKDESRGFYEQHPELVALYEKIVPLGRMCTADDIADAVMFLSGDGASFISGQNLVVDGGLSVQWHESLARRVSPLHDLSVTRTKPDSSR